MEEQIKPENKIVRIEGLSIWNNFKDKLNKFGAKISEPGLIEFDYRVLMVILIVFLMFVISVTFKVSGSSVAYWNKYFKGYNQTEGLIAGVPKAIRSDEWFISTPSFMGQKEQNLPIHNINVGANNDPLLTNMPVKHITAIFRPQFWGYFFLGSERAFSFNWNFKIFGLVLSAFLFLLLLTKNNFWVALFGALWIYFSSFIQWWFSSIMPDAALLFGFILIPAIYFLFSRKKIIIYLSSMLLAGSLINFVMLLYPSLQVPLVYLLILILLGYFLRDSEKNWSLIKKGGSYRIIAGGISLIVLAFVLGRFYIDGKSTIQAITDTVYPGKRVNLGGGLGFARLFSGFYSNFFSENSANLNVHWGNICEASTFVLFFPMFVFIAINKYLKENKFDPLVFILSLYFIFLSLWVMVPFPAWFSKITLFSYATPNRTLLTLGLTSIIISVIVLSDMSAFKTKINNLTKYIFLGLVFIFIAWIGYKINLELPTFAAKKYVPLISILFTGLTWLLLINKRLIFGVVLLIIVIIPNFLVNPVTYGLSPIYDKSIAHYLQGTTAEQKNGLWVVYGSFVYPSYFEAFGMHVFNSVKYTPDLTAMTFLDPEKKNEYVYNRYAIIIFDPNANNQKEIEFKLIQPELYSITIDPCNPILKKIGVKYLAFDESSSNYNISCLKPLTNQVIDGFSLFEFR